MSCCISPSQLIIPGIDLTHFSCSYCGDIPTNPVVGKCEHISCVTCIASWVKENHTCPISNCKQPLSLEQLTPPGRLITNVFNSFQIKCENADRGCNFSTPFNLSQDMDQHLKECPKAPISCPHNGCNAEIDRESYEEHTCICDHRLVKCDACSHNVKATEIENHKAHLCHSTEILCSCGHRMLRGDQDYHNTHCVDRVAVVCPVNGCRQEIPRTDLEKHLLSSLTEHFRLLAIANHEKDNQIQELTSQIENWSRRWEETDRELKELQEAHRDLEWYGNGTWRREGECCIWKLGNMNQRIKGASIKQSSSQGQPLPELIWSPQYYTHEGGYRFSMRLDLANPQKIGVFVHIHEGEYDEQTPWPFGLDYTVMIGRVQATISQRESYMHYATQGRPPHELSWGWAQFCGLEQFSEAILKDTLDIAIVFHSPPISPLYAQAVPQAIPPHVHIPNFHIQPHMHHHHHLHHHHHQHQHQHHHHHQLGDKVRNHPNSTGAY